MDQRAIDGTVILTHTSIPAQPADPTDTQDPRTDSLAASWTTVHAFRRKKQSETSDRGRHRQNWPSFTVDGRRDV